MYLALFVNGLSAILGLTVIAGYLFLYTPLKTRTTLSTAVGAFPGAMPPLIGWTAARGEIDVAAWVLFAILFLWQFPHFLAIAWMYREDYGRAGIRMLPVVEPEGRVTGQQIIAYSLMLVPVSLLPTILGISGKFYFAAALVLGLPDRFYVVTTAIYQLVSQYPPRIQTAAAMGMSLFAVMFVMLFLYRRIITRRPW